MMIREDISEFMTGRVSFPLSNYLLNRRHIISEYKGLTDSQWLHEEEIVSRQFEKLHALVAYAYRWVPFYRDRFSAIGLEPGDIRCLEDMKSIPPLSRDDVVDNRHRLIDSRLVKYAMAADRSGRGAGEPIMFSRFRRNRIVRNTSSGSTGAPTVFYEDGSRSALNWALELRLKNWFGLGPGAREARMVRLSTSSLLGGRRGLRAMLWNQLILPGVRLDDEEYALCCKRLEEYRPRVLWGFSSALVGLARYVRREGVDPSVWGLKVVVGWAAPLHLEERRLLEEVFFCPASNIYSAREVGHIAGLCPHGSFHVNQEHHFVETVTAEGSSSVEGQGEILVTTLDLSPMPFIRYRMGDIGNLAGSDCGCGRKLQVIKELFGRTGEIFLTREGTMISPNFWCRTFMEPTLAEAVKRFQVVYHGDHSLTLRLVRGRNFTQDNEAYLKSHLERNFDPGFRFDFEYVDEIRPLVSGKYLMVIQET